MRHQGRAGRYARWEKEFRSGCCRDNGAGTEPERMSKFCTNGYRGERKTFLKKVYRRAKAPKLDRKGNVWRTASVQRMWAGRERPGG